MRRTHGGSGIATRISRYPFGDGRFRHEFAPRELWHERDRCPGGGASLLVSRNCGVTSVLALEEGDNGVDCEDESEVARKILHLASHPNPQRLYDALDFDALGWDVAARRHCGDCRGGGDTNAEKKGRG